MNRQWIRRGNCLLLRVETDLLILERVSWVDDDTWYSKVFVWWCLIIEADLMIMFQSQADFWWCKLILWCLWIEGDLMIRYEGDVMMMFDRRRRGLKPNLIIEWAANNSWSRMMMWWYERRSLSLIERLVDEHCFARRDWMMQLARKRDLMQSGGGIGWCF